VDDRIRPSVDWAAVEARRGRAIPPDERLQVELSCLRDETDALVNRADWHERMTALTLDEIATAHAQGQTHEEYLAELQAGFDVTDED
jgi:hypothetical protein